jgi:D-3-phosphoglycerate dehydrogenase
MSIAAPRPASWLQPIRGQQGGGRRARRGPHARPLQEDHGDRPGDTEDNNIERFRYVGTELLGKTIGIVGLGNIGSRVAEICRSAFRMTVLAYDPYLSKEKMAGA